MSANRVVRTESIMQGMQARVREDLLTFVRKNVGEIRVGLKLQDQIDFD